jgi:hypothetical protein
MQRAKESTKLIVLAVMVLFLAMTGVIMSSGRASSIDSAAIHTSELQGQDGNRAKLIRVFVHEFDLYPDLIRIKPGKVLIRAENEKRAEIALVIERVGPGQSRQQTARVSAARHLRRADQEITLGVGEYVFYEESQPALKGALIVEPQ